jgi:hypothetical protein
MLGGLIAPGMLVMRVLKLVPVAVSVQSMSVFALV